MSPSGLFLASVIVGGFLVGFMLAAVALAAVAVHLFGGYRP